MREFGIIVLIGLMLFRCAEPDVKEMPEEEIEMQVDVPQILIDSKNKEVSKKQNGDILYAEALFSGYLITKYDNDSIYLMKGYFDGKQNGLTTAFYQNGDIQYLRPYLKGEKHGKHVGYHQNGQKAFEYYFVSGFNEGNHKEWFPDGSLAADMNYVNGKELGKQQVWRPDGKLRSNYIVRENRRRYGLQGIKRCTKLDGATQSIDPYKGNEE